MARQTKNSRAGTKKFWFHFLEKQGREMSEFWSVNGERIQTRQTRRCDFSVVLASVPCGRLPPFLSKNGRSYLLLSRWQSTDASTIWGRAGRKTFFADRTLKVRPLSK
ncbi:DUF1661 domain-containing protein [Porphyromonas gingivalis]|uniref:DUF1661 domain-containing protein n=1 Tax=Porphyromonas gingivalis TaxID=837 RepID=UPI001E583F9D|nr:DUF1661 domain-containing protein [Porphyromonas gingivalis]